MAGNSERRNDNSTPSLTAKSNAGNNNDVVVWADPATHALLISGTISSGSLTNNNAAPGANNQGVLPAIANAAAPTYTEGYQVLLSTDLSGALRVTGSLSVGGTTDNSAYTAGSSTGTPAMGFYHSTVDSVTDGRAAAVGMTVKRAMFVSLYDASGNALLGQKTTANSVPVALASDATLPVTNAGTFAVQATPVTQADTFMLGGVNIKEINAVAPLMGNGVTGTGSLRVTIASDNTAFAVNATLSAETTKVIGTTRTLGNAGAIFDGVNTAATAPANGVLTLGIYNSTEPSPTTGQSVGIQLDSKGRQRGVIMDAAGNTRGANVNASNQLSVSVDNTVTVASHAVTIASGGVASGAIASGAVASGAVASGAFASGSIAAGAVAAGATSFVKLEDVASADADAGVPAMAIRKATPANTSGTDGDYEMLQMSGGKLWTQASGSVATNVAIADNPLNLGAQAVSSENAAVTTARQVQLVADLVGKLIVMPYANPENFVSGVTAAMTGTTSTSLIAAPASGLRNYITHIIATNSHATVGTFVIIQDGSGGTTIYEGYAAAVGGGFSITFPTPLRQPTTATAIYCADVTTGANVIVSASGYKGA